MREKLMDLQLFAELNVNTTEKADAGVWDLSPEMKVFYNTSLLENSRQENYFNQFGMKQPLPKNNGKTVEWRRFQTFEKAMTPLTEGVTPDGNKVVINKIEATIDQYGDYTTISDRLELEAVDPIITGVTEEHGAQAGETLDTITRNVVVAGTNVIYGGDKTSRDAITAADILTPELVNQGVTMLKKMNAPQVEGGGYIAIVHPSCTYDLRQSDEWVEAHKYASPEEIYNGEIGRLHNVRFVESPNQKVWTTGTTTTTAVYAVTMFGKDAYGIVEPSAESMQVIVKPKGSAGTADPLDQRSSVGWKASHTAAILYQERLVRLEVGSKYSDRDEEN